MLKPKLAVAPEGKPSDTVKFTSLVVVTKEFVPKRKPVLCGLDVCPQEITPVRTGS